jgi:ParB/RepB/Spo0J family partition protein
MQVHDIALTEILTDETNRFRGATGDIKGLAQSLIKYGQLAPVILERDGRLIAGYRRVTAARLAGWVSVKAYYRDEIDRLTARELELEENIQREQMSWLEVQKAIAAIHDIKQTKDPNWTQDQTAQLTGVHNKRVSEALTITRMVDIFPEIAEAKSPYQALMWARIKAKNVLRVKHVRDNPEEFRAVEDRVLLGDSIELIKQVPSNSFDLVLTDPPYGIDYDKILSDTEGSMSSYVDSESSYERILSIIPELYRVIKPDGWCVWFLSIIWYQRCKEAFREAGFSVDDVPIVWDRSESPGYTASPNRWFGRAYEIALHCAKGKPHIVQKGKADVIRVAPVSPSTRDIIVERPVELYAELIRRLTISGEAVADFFAGSGSSLAAAASLRRSYFGVELDPERRAVAIQKIRSHTPDEVINA